MIITIKIDIKGKTKPVMVAEVVKNLEIHNPSHANMRLLKMKQEKKMIELKYEIEENEKVHTE
uniref:Uncharacterized protein n=1 Tax=viral metagenome TaxID=1070528 RepID=A0A6M3IEQ0_9ZZZZ